MDQQNPRELRGKVNIKPMLLAHVNFDEEIEEDSQQTQMPTMPASTARPTQGFKDEVKGHCP